MPERRIAGAIRIEGVDAIVFCGDVKDVVRAFAGDGDGRDVEWLRVDCAVYFERAEFAELLRIDILRCKNLLVQRCGGAGVVVLRCRDLRGTWADGQRQSGSSEESAEVHGTLRNGLMGRLSRPDAICSGESPFILDVLEKLREAMPVS